MRGANMASTATTTTATTNSAAKAATAERTAQVVNSTAQLMRQLRDSSHSEIVAQLPKELLGKVPNIKNTGKVACATKSKLYSIPSGRTQNRKRIFTTTIRSSSYIPANGAVNGTYGPDNAQWLSNELQRLCSNKKSQGDDLVLTRGQWSWVLQNHGHYQLKGEMKFHNISKRLELFIPEVSGKLQLMANVSLDSVNSSVKIIPRHPGGSPAPRPDGYWTAYIVKAGESTTIEVLVDIVSKNGDSLGDLQTGVVEIEYISYGPHGRTKHVQHAILPLHYPDISISELHWRKAEGDASVLPIPTHLLSHLDDPLQVLRKYVLPFAKTGDVIAIGETPLAIMQGRFRHPQNVRPGVLARIACRLFHPTSSLATACGLQVLIDISGRLRVIVAVFLAVIGRVLGSRGMFYRFAGEQARLIDDVTGTLPPYDQFITLGPVRVQATVDALKRKIGVDVAVVDVNDLKRVQVLAASQGVNHGRLEAALRYNPAGNADEQTPIVLIRESAD